MSEINIDLHIYLSWYGTMYERQYTDKTLTLWKSMYAMRAERAGLEIFAFLHL